jgi:hypothetical protein
LKPWNDPHAAIYRPPAAAWGEMMKSPDEVNASLFVQVETLVFFT